MDNKFINYNNYDFSSYSFKTSAKNISLNMNYIQIMTLKKYIEFIYNCDTSWTYKRDSILNFSLIIKNSIKYNSKKTDVTSNITFTNNNFSKLTVISYSNKEKCDDSLKKIIRDYNKQMAKDVKNLCEKILGYSVEENYYFEPVQLCYGSINGFYNFGRVVVDAGKRNVTYDKPQIIKMKIKYNKVIVKEMPIGTPVCDTMLIDRSIMNRLIQLIIRFPFEKRISDGKYYKREEFYSTHNFELDEQNIGNTYSINRNEIITNNLIGFPDDTQKIIDKFYSLDYEKKNTFMKSCTSYINGLNSNSTKALAYYVLAIENIANFNSKPSQSIQKQGSFYAELKGNKKDIIYKIINNVYGKEIVSVDYINMLYKARSSHVHDGLENNDILENALEIDEHSKTIIDSAERLTHSFLIKWLLII